ncbi:MAG TPA: hypothetical protein VIW94_11275 [Acidimicrobiia bacterium]
MAQEIAKKRANPHASGPSTAKKHNIIVAVPYIGQWYYSNIVTGIAALGEAAIQAMFETLDGNPRTGNLLLDYELIDRFTTGPAKT